MLELGKITGPLKKKQDAIIKIGKGQQNDKFEYCLSGPIELQQLKQKSKALDVTINELFSGAIVTAYSKLDLPEERTPSQFLGMSAVSTATDRQIDDQFQPENNVTSIGPVYERCEDLA